MPLRKLTIVLNVALEWMVNLGMNEYISKEYIRNIELKRWSDSCGAESYAYSRVLEDIAEAPIADVVEVKHGHWIVNSEIMHCSVCGYETSVLRQYVYNGEKWLPLEAINYCGNCGAKMDQEEA